ncbi:Zinc finger MIZ-type [Penicillium verhagenii]|nr:Zinc finger MIZ-type [Penicillium verhagenii]
MKSPDTQRSRPTDHIEQTEKSNSTASLFLGGIRKNWMSSSQLTPSATSHRHVSSVVPATSSTTVRSDPKNTELVLMPPATPGEMPQSSALPTPSAPAVTTTTVAATTATPAIAAETVASNKPNLDPNTAAFPSPSRDFEGSTRHKFSNPPARRDPNICHREDCPSIATPIRDAFGLTRHLTGHISGLKPLWKDNGAVPPSVPTANGTRSPISRDHPVGCLPDQSTWEQWRKAIEQVRKVSAKSACLIAEPRVALLQQACRDEDLFYLVLHQIFCRISLDDDVYSDLPSLHNDACIRGFQRVTDLLESNKFLSREMIIMLARLPVPPKQGIQFGWYNNMVQEIAGFLPLLASHFNDQKCEMYVQTANRHFPPLLHEMQQLFRIKSTVFLGVIFASMCRHLYDEIYFNTLNGLYQKNVRLDEEGMPDHTRYQLIDEYRTIPLKGESPNQMARARVLAEAQVAQVSRPVVAQSIPSSQPSSASSRIHPSQRPVSRSSNGLQVSPNVPTSQPPASTQLTTHQPPPASQQPPTRQLSSTNQQPPINQQPRVNHQTPTSQGPPAATQHPARRPPPIVTVPHGQSPYQYPSEHVPQTPQTQRMQQIQQVQQAYQLQRLQQVQQAQLMNRHVMTVPSQQTQHWPTNPWMTPHMQVSPGQQSPFPQMAPQSGQVPGPSWSYIPLSVLTTPTLLNSAQPSGPRSTVSSPEVAPGGQRRESQVSLQNHQAHLRNFVHGSNAPSSRSPQIANGSPHPSPAMTPLLPPHGHRIPQVVQADPMRLGLHQADLRDPMKKCVKKGPGGELYDTELYHYVSDFALAPTIVDPKGYNYVWKFSLSAEDVTRHPRPVETPSKEGHRRILTYQSGCRTFRLRCIALPALETANSEKLWHTTPTTWPSVFYIHLNGKEFTPRRKAHNGKDLPIDITLDLKEGENKLQIDLLLGPDECKDIRYYFGVEILDVTRFELVRSLVRAIPANIVRQRISRRLNQTVEDDDLAVVSSNLTISLIDPFTAQIFTTPARSSLCGHQECFDLETFITTRKSTSGPTPMNDNWRCPICNADARPQLLVLDRFLEAVRAQLIATHQLEGAQSIQIKPDGTWAVSSTQDDAAPSQNKSQQPLGNKRKAPGDMTKPLESLAARRLKVEKSASPISAVRSSLERIVIEIDD